MVEGDLWSSKMVELVRHSLHSVASNKYFVFFMME